MPPLLFIRFIKIIRKLKIISFSLGNSQQLQHNPVRPVRRQLIV